MKIEAVTVCVGYDDFLAETARLNRGLFDTWVIVTEARDEKTREVCRRYNLKCVLSDDGRRGGDFCKGRLIERGLQHLSREGWRLHIDSDIALPYDFRNRIKAADVQEDSIYGVDRLMIQSWERWKRLLDSGYLHGGQFDYHCRTNPVKDLQIGTRWTHHENGYVPIGFFQLWHSTQDEWRGVRIKSYPHDHGNACRTDVQHALQWDRSKRVLIPEIFAVHLESQEAKLGANWSGRTTKRFGPDAGDSGPSVMEP